MNVTHLALNFLKKWWWKWDFVYHLFWVSSNVAIFHHGCRWNKNWIILCSQVFIHWSDIVRDFGAIQVILSSEKWGSMAKYSLDFCCIFFPAYYWSKGSLRVVGRCFGNWIDYKEGATCQVIFDGIEIERLIICKVRELLKFSLLRATFIFSQNIWHCISCSIN